MRKYNHIEKETEKRFKQKDKRKKPRMKVSGKSVFKLKELIKRKHDRTYKRPSPKSRR
jgi:hypothetical protein